MGSLVLSAEVSPQDYCCVSAVQVCSAKGVLSEVCVPV